MSTCPRTLKKIERKDCTKTKWLGEVKKILTKKNWEKLCQKTVNGQISGPNWELFGKKQKGTDHWSDHQDVVFLLYDPQNQSLTGLLFGKLMTEDSEKIFYIELICGTRCGAQFFKEAEKYAKEHSCSQMALRAAASESKQKRLLIENYKHYGFQKKFRACKKKETNKETRKRLDEGDTAAIGHGSWMTKCLEPDPTTINEFEKYWVRVLGKNFNSPFYKYMKERFEQYYELLMRQKPQLLTPKVTNDFTKLCYKYCNLFPSSKLC